VAASWRGGAATWLRGAASARRRGGITPRQAIAIFAKAAFLYPNWVQKTAFLENR
jgi:hypothetical protein